MRSAPPSASARAQFTALWRNADFVKLWAAQTVSQFGSQVTLFALPLVAALTLGASPAQMGILSAVEFAPFLLLGLVAGVWVDRLPRRAILIATDLARAALLLAIPAAALAGRLSMGLLYAVAALTGCCTVFFDVAYQSYLPALVRRDDLAEGNGKLEASRSVAQIAGPGLAGGLVQLVTAPFALLVDAVSFLLSGFALALIRAREGRASGPTGGGRILAEIGEGLRVVLHSPLLRPIAACTATANLFGTIGQAIFVLYVTRQLGIGPGLLGVIFAAGNLGALLGAAAASRVARRCGLGATIIGSITFGGLGGLLVPLAGGPRAVAVPLLIAGQALLTFGGVMYNVNQVSLRQAITPGRLLGRMNATMRFIVWGTIPVGALTGGFLGEAIGLRPTLVVGAAGALLAPLFP
ncbi:MAG: MFS transporter, partial [Chloroflexota bacterium]|nr:MFS transporter [Chloroflexota bacterium]